MYIRICVFKLYDERQGDILELLRFCFPECEETDAQGEEADDQHENLHENLTEIDEKCYEGCPEDLKELVVAYLGCFMKQLWGEEFKSPYLRCPELVLNLTTTLIKGAWIE